jgi:hypothetical protein
VGGHQVDPVLGAGLVAVPGLTLSMSMSRDASQGDGRRQVTPSGDGSVVPVQVTLLAQRVCLAWGA